MVLQNLRPSVGRIPLQELNAIPALIDEEVTASTATITGKRVSFNNKFNIK